MVRLCTSWYSFKVCMPVFRATIISFLTWSSFSIFSFSWRNLSHSYCIFWFSPFRKSTQSCFWTPILAIISSSTRLLFFSKLWYPLSHLPPHLSQSTWTLLHFCRCFSILFRFRSLLHHWHDVLTSPQTLGWPLAARTPPLPLSLHFGQYHTSARQV